MSKELFGVWGMYFHDYCRGAIYSIVFTICLFISPD